MAHAIAHLDNTSGLSGLAAQAHGLVARIAGAIAGYRAYSQTRRELDVLSDRELADIGLSRADIVRIARSSVYGL